MKNRGFSRFPNVSWEIWVSKVTTPQDVCRSKADLYAGGTRNVGSAVEKYQFSSAQRGTERGMRFGH